MPGTPLKAICYVLNYFPEPSLTFISDEAASLMHLDITPYVLTFNHGLERSVLQPSARKIIDQGLFRKIVIPSKARTLRAIPQLALRNPRKTFFCCMRILKSKDRWHYMSSAPYALFLQDHGVQYIHTHFADENLKWTKALSEWTGLPFGVTTHGYDLREDPMPAGEVSKLLFQANLVVAISGYNQDLMVKKYGIAKDAIKTIHCGIDTQAFRRSDKTERFVGNHLRIVNIGRLVPEKAQDVLFQALAAVKKRGVQFDLQIVGAGPLLDQLKELARSLDIIDHIDFLGAQPQDVVIKVLREADVFVLSSRNEGLPVVCMEAMAMEVFLIATNISGIPELVQHGQNGLLVEPENVQELADAILWVDKNRKLLEGMCFAARKKVEEEFDRKKCTRSLALEIEQCLVTQK
ncbi:Glycosyltransferase involved in cell wall bisynthesis [Desulfonatronum thiosulfatophilum]|uniref:Glycosyltransferase involved in cell wall bisynthesis n=1 Tax=Desulfonatronum thiosulfatophilum TaxID=617002 RepID=A0A1G6ELB0_9BACT|nr:glycosyltransferase family 4 protein [Desulfonatronum thiosulfatophilum]SDB58219.1 Glycosyltransferase involved in cell wall bisynthesis [Desulfonatronum thiosulfatophilum]